MSEQSKTRRFFDLILWLQKEGRPGISRERICDEYQISEKTFSRDVQELLELLPAAVRYERSEERLYANFSLTEKATGPAPTPHAPLPDGALLVHTEATFRTPQTHPEFPLLLEAVLEPAYVAFEYRAKQRTGVPLFFCFYAEHWYLFLLRHGDGLILKFRLDQVRQARKVLVPPAPLPDGLPALKQEAAERIRRSHNIFVDLNAREPLHLSLRFFFPASFLREKIPHLESVHQPDPHDPAVTDVALTFSGYSEARVFLNTWLGQFQVLAPAEFRQRYAEELEEALDTL